MYACSTLEPTIFIWDKDQRTFESTNKLLNVDGNNMNENISTSVGLAQKLYKRNKIWIVYKMRALLD